MGTPDVAHSELESHAGNGGGVGSQGGGSLSSVIVVVIVILQIGLKNRKGKEQDFFLHRNNFFFNLVWGKGMTLKSALVLSNRFLRGRNFSSLV